MSIHLFLLSSPASCTQYHVVKSKSKNRTDKNGKTMNKNVRLESRLYSYNETWITITTVDDKSEHLLIIIQAELTPISRQSACR